MHAHAAALAPRPPALQGPVPSLGQLGFGLSKLSTLRLPAGARGGRALFDEFLGRIGAYRDARDFPAVRGPQLPERAPALIS